jgi:hypothetical protein
MKKKYRDIIIDGEHWAWSFITQSDDEGYRYGAQKLKIWSDKKIVVEKSYGIWNKKKKYQITPSLVSRFIKLYLKK